MLELIERYTKFQENNEEKILNISLDDYLDVAMICYNGAYPEEIKDLNPLETYKKYSDGRHGGMLNISEPSSIEEFEKWLNSEEPKGNHPFEIVIGYMQIGICLFPPNKYFLRNNFGLITHNEEHFKSYLKMVDNLIKHKIQFKAPHLEHIFNSVQNKNI